MMINRNIQMRALDVSDTDKFYAAADVNFVLNISHRPGLADKVLIDGTSIINTETRLTILASRIGNGKWSRARAPLYFIFVEHILTTHVDHGLSALGASM